MPARVASLQAVVRRAATATTATARATVPARAPTSSVFAAYHSWHALNRPDRLLAVSRTVSLSRPFSVSAASRAASASASTPMAAETDSSAAVAAASSGITPETLSQKLKETIHATHVVIEDMSGGCGQAFNAIIVSPDFAGKGLLARHRLVNNALRTEIAAIHAWTPKCLTPEQWDKEKDKMDL